jgi:hypothetical protein
LPEADFAVGTFDLIRRGHVMKHTLDPLAALRRASGLRKSGDVLMGETRTPIMSISESSSNMGAAASSAP